MRVIFVLVFLFLLSSMVITLNIDNMPNLVFTLLFFFASVTLSLLVMWLVFMAYYSTQWMRNKVLYSNPTGELPPIEEQKLLSTKSYIPAPTIVSDPDYIQFIENLIK